MSESSLELHQQEGGFSLEDFAVLHGITERQVNYLCRTGGILGARKLSTRWWIYPPAKLVREIRPYSKAEKAAGEALPFRAGRSSRPGAMASFTGHAGTYRTQAVDAEPVSPSVDRVLPGVPPSVFAGRQVKKNVRDIRLAASQALYPVVFSGQQLLLLECALLHEAQAVKERRVALEFEELERVEAGEDLKALYDALRALKDAASGKGVPS